MIAAVPLWICDHCGGAAVWTFFGGEPFYHCESKCDGFMQMELPWDDGVQQITRGGDAQDAGRLPSEKETFLKGSTS